MSAHRRICWSETVKHHSDVLETPCSLWGGGGGGEGRLANHTGGSTTLRLSSLTATAEFCDLVAHMCVIERMYVCEWSERVKHVPVIAKCMCEWTKEAFFLQRKPVNKEGIMAHSLVNGLE